MKLTLPQLVGLQAAYAAASVESVDVTRTGDVITVTFDETPRYEIAADGTLTGLNAD